MNMLHKKLISMTAVACMVTPLAANATNGILPFGNGMVAHGFGGAGIANASETMSGVDNPALVSNTSEQWTIAGSVFMPYRSADPGSGTYVESESNFFIVPQGGYTSNISSTMDYGVLLYAMGGMNTDYPDASQFNSLLPATRVGMDLSGLVIAPTLSFKIDDSSSIGASLLVGYAKLETEGPGVGGFPGNESDTTTGYGFKLGYHVKAGESTTIGVIYQSVIDMGEMSFCDSIFAGLKATGKDCSIDMPDQYGVGVTHKLNKTWMLVADILQVNWSNVDVFAHGFAWEDQTIYKIGAEYDMGGGNALRFGYNYGKSPIKDSGVGLNLLAPAVTETHYVAGYGMKLDSKSELNMYFAYVPETEQSGTAYQGSPPTPIPGATARVKMNQYALGVGYNVRF
ncbi:MAG: outer membrane protein transport protein [Gammaproteobacteria bacterium]|nr:outer membrane protein transport protein [Gammaproteobacteria bacterium]MDH5776607.1 outer membrane protein transport protein [Gammaproteobacteria bacterium]